MTVKFCMNILSLVLSGIKSIVKHKVRMCIFHVLVLGFIRSFQPVNHNALEVMLSQVLIYEVSGAEGLIV